MKLNEIFEAYQKAPDKTASTPSELYGDIGAGWQVFVNSSVIDHIPQHISQEDIAKSAKQIRKQLFAISKHRIVVKGIIIDDVALGIKYLCNVNFTQKKIWIMKFSNSFDYKVTGSYSTLTLRNYNVGIHEVFTNYDTLTYKDYEIGEGSSVNAFHSTERIIQRNLASNISQDDIEAAFKRFIDKLILVKQEGLDVRYGLIWSNELSQAILVGIVPSRSSGKHRIDIVSYYEPGTRDQKANTVLFNV